MNKKKLSALASNYLFAILCGSNVCADICPSDFYVGFYVLKTSFSTKAGYGSNVFAKNPTAFNAFVGYKLPRNFFVEAGYEWTGKKGRTVDDVDVSTLPGITELPAGLANIPIQTKVKIKSPYIGVGLSYPISFVNNTVISGLVGLSRTKIKAELNDLFTNDNAFGGVFAKSKTTPMFKIILCHNVSKSLGIRFSATWHKLTNFKILDQNEFLEIKMKNGYAFGLGVSYSFY